MPGCEMLGGKSMIRSMWNTKVVEGKGHVIECLGLEPLEGVGYCVAPRSSIAFGGKEFCSCERKDLVV